MTMNGRQLQLKLLAVVAVLLVSFFLVVAIHYDSYRSTLFCVTLVLFFASLYWCDRRAGLHRHMRRGLAYVATVLGSFISSFFFFHGRLSPAGMPPTLRVVGGGLCFVVAAYYLHRLTVLHRDYCEEEEAAAADNDQQAHAHRQVMMPLFVASAHTHTLARPQ